MLKIDSVCKQSKKYHLQAYAKDCNYTDAESMQCSMLSDSDCYEGYFVVT